MHGHASDVIHVSELPLDPVCPTRPFSRGNFRHGAIQIGVSNGGCVAAHARFDGRFGAIDCLDADDGDSDDQEQSGIYQPATTHVHG